MCGSGKSPLVLAHAACSQLVAACQVLYPLVVQPVGDRRLRRYGQSNTEQARQTVACCSWCEVTRSDLCGVTA